MKKVNSILAKTSTRPLKESVSFESLVQKKACFVLFLVVLLDLMFPLVLIPKSFLMLSGRAFGKN